MSALSDEPDPVMYEIDDDPGRVNLGVVSRFLLHEAYWDRWRTAGDVARQFERAWRVVGCYVAETGEMVGGARAVSDGVAVAYLADVFVVAEHRGRGLGAALVRRIVDEGPGADFRWLLHTADAHDLYGKFGFGPAGDRLLERPAVAARQPLL